MDSTFANFLFADPSFLSGMGRVIDLGGAFDDYNESQNVAEAEANQMRLDWWSVGQFLAESMDEQDGAAASEPAK